MLRFGFTGGQIRKPAETAVDYRFGKKNGSGQSAVKKTGIPVRVLPICSRRRHALPCCRQAPGKWSEKAPLNA
jgi:hypothetical protein